MLNLISSSNRQSPATANRDLYVSKRDSSNGFWSLPAPFTMLNACARESCASLSPDEHRRYFTSPRTDLFSGG